MSTEKKPFIKTLTLSRCCGGHIKYEFTPAQKKGERKYGPLREVCCQCGYPCDRDLYRVVYDKPLNDEKSATDGNGREAGPAGTEQSEPVDSRVGEADAPNT